MNWDRLQTYGLSSEKSFEMLCNQLFENWCKEEYGSSLQSFQVVNGSGGDGGVESYAVLNDGSIVGLQAKWFRSSITSSQIGQIRSSLKTAKKVRPNIARYIVCIPRDLASTTARGNNTESNRWNEFVDSSKKGFPDLLVELWNDTRLTAEIQKSFAAGIHKFWFSNSEMGFEKYEYSFNLAKHGWLSTKYTPDLNVTGQITRHLWRYVGDFDLKCSLLSRFADIIDLTKQFDEAVDALISVCDKKHLKVVELCEKTKEALRNMRLESQKAYNWLHNDFSVKPVFEEESFFVPFESLIKRFRENGAFFEYHFHIYEITRVLRKLSDTDCYGLLAEVKESLNSECVLFLGNPGTGKTHGVSAFADSLLKQHYHIPLIIQARSIPENYNWKDIIIFALGLSDTWNEEELWQALVSSANRNRFQKQFMHRQVSISPKVLIIVDGIDESSSYTKWIQRIEETAGISEKYPQIRFCFTSRPAVFPASVDYANVKRLSESGDAPVCKLFDAYISAYDITVQNCQWLKYALNTPLALKLFCELYAGETVRPSEISEVAMNQLWRKKIERIQVEYSEKERISSKSQHVFKSITAISRCFLEKTRVERSELLATIKKYVEISDEKAEKILDYLSDYGIIGSFCRKGSGISADTYVYYTGIQGYFDFASAVQLLNKYKDPSLINFELCGDLDINTLYCLAVISIQQYDYLLTRNPTIEKALDGYTISELQFYALQHTDSKTAIQFRARSLEIMQEGADALVTIVNRLVLPLSRMQGHPLGVSLLDDFLNQFETPAQRDIVWSLPAYLHKSGGERWEKYDVVATLREDDGEYVLTKDDQADGLPLIYAWMLSSVSNPDRKKCRDMLMIWAQESPRQYYKLFLHFAGVNDPQIRSDMFSIMMCLVYDVADTTLVKEIADWVLLTTLAPSKVDQNRDIAVRYYAIAIVERAKTLGLLTGKDIEDYLPPYSANNFTIGLNKDALSGTRMGGYSAIDYDLARYVLIDHFSYCFAPYSDMQFEKLIEKVAEEQPDYARITPDQFILSAAYAFVLQMGWKKEDFYNYEKDESGKCQGGPDLSIKASFHSATHGAQSEVMTVCEKYVWQARNYISGFLSDRLLLGDETQKVTDYGLLDDFIIPIQEINQLDPDNIPTSNPWYVPEQSVVVSSKKLNSKTSISEYIKKAPDIGWEKWICVDNNDLKYAISSRKLLALKLYSCFYGLSGAETCLFINSIVLPSKNVSRFIKTVHKKSFFSRVCNPTDWDGGIEASCYITPKEVCWFPWKKHFESHLAEEFPNLSIRSAVDGCCYNFPEYSDVYYSMPSVFIRSLLGIVDTNGYLYYDVDKKVVSEYSIAGEKWRTSQEYVLVDRETLLQKLNASGFSLVWIMQDMRRETGTAKEQFGEFYAERRQYSVGYFENGKFVVEKLISDFSEDLND